MSGTKVPYFYKPPPSSMGLLPTYPGLGLCCGWLSLAVTYLTGLWKQKEVRDCVLVSSLEKEQHKMCKCYSSIQSMLQHGWSYCKYAVRRHTMKENRPAHGHVLAFMRRPCLHKTRSKGKLCWPKVSAGVWGQGGGRRGHGEVGFGQRVGGGAWDRAWQLC